MQGNTYHYEVTTIPAYTYYAVSIDSLPSGQYYLCVYQGSNYVIGMFIIDYFKIIYYETPMDFINYFDGDVLFMQQQ